MKLKDTSLWKERGFIAGQWVPADSGQTTEIRNPANGELLGTVPHMGAAETRRAIDAAHAACGPIGDAALSAVRESVVERVRQRHFVKHRLAAPPTAILQIVGDGRGDIASIGPDVAMAVIVPIDGGGEINVRHELRLAKRTGPGRA